MHARETKAAQQAPGRIPARRVSSPGSVADRVLALQRQVGNAAVSRMIQRRAETDQHQHGAGCGHGGIDDRSPEGQSQLLAAAQKTPGSPLPSAFLAKAQEFYQNPNIAAGRVHADPVAQRATAAMGAEAMTVGMDVFLGPSAVGNTKILAHEASHLDKNSRGVKETGNGNGAGVTITSPAQDSEVAAVSDSDAFMSGVDTAPSVAVQRSEEDHADEKK
ncbi:DUF4157 domain-containing protein [Streptomyces sp. NPDC006296]|uniref:eCIS core domain-containing protein n=1 Tax=Streptomyces sp. NPDC006296 TaxID=3156746 RepID=UPI0033BD7E3B